MLVIDKDNYEAEVQQNAASIVLDFWGPQCGPCLALMPDVEKLAAEYEGKVRIGKVNVAENRRLCISLKVMSVPTFLFFKGGECVDRLSGDDVSLANIKAKVQALA